MRRCDPIRPAHPRTAGFSLVEMLVALLFTALLMAGLATVFQTSLGTFVTSGERISSARRNRMSVDMIYDDLNAAGMLLTSLADYSGSEAFPISLNPLNPPFRISPNVPYAGTDVAAPNNVADQLFLYFDEALPFEGTVTNTLQDAASVVAAGGALAPVTSAISLRDDSQAQLVSSKNSVSPVAILFRAQPSLPLKPASLAAASNQVNFTLGVDTRGPSGPTANQIPAGTAALFVRPGLYVRYSIQARNLDPDPANAGRQVPCLVRDEVVYSGVSAQANPFLAPDSSTIVAENVVGFQVMVSPDGGNTWINNPYDPAQAGPMPTAALPGIPHTTYATWGALTALLNANGAITGRPAPYNRVDDSRFWFKDIPVTVRVDITTRTARPRAEYLQSTPASIINSTGGVPYKIQTQSIVLNPRHSGLPYDVGLF